MATKNDKTTTPASSTTTAAPPADMGAKMLDGINRIVSAKGIAAKFEALDKPVTVAVPAEMAGFLTSVGLVTKTQKDGAVLVFSVVVLANGSETKARLGWCKATKAGKLGWHVDVVRTKAPSGVL